MDTSVNNGVYSCASCDCVSSGRNGFQRELHFSRGDSKIQFVIRKVLSPMSHRFPQDQTARGWPVFPLVSIK